MKGERKDQIETYFKGNNVFYFEVQRKIHCLFLQDSEIFKLILRLEIGLTNFIKNHSKYTVNTGVYNKPTKLHLGKDNNEERV